VFQICRATSIKNPGFLPLLSQFLIESSRPLPVAADLERLDDAIRKGSVRFYMALEGEERVVGVVSLTLGFSTMRMQPFALLADLYVHPGHRGRGAAAALLLAAMDAAHELRCGFLTTETARGMEGVFQRFGWAQTTDVLAFEVDTEGPPPSLTITGDLVFD
jgi:GNAT superfamily N-acetyltransferase